MQNAVAAIVLARRIKNQNCLFGVSCDITQLSLNLVNISPAGLGNRAVRSGSIYTVQT